MQCTSRRGISVVWPPWIVERAGRLSKFTWGRPKGSMPAAGRCMLKLRSTTKLRRRHLQVWANTSNSSSLHFASQKKTSNLENHEVVQEMPASELSSWMPADPFALLSPCSLAPDIVLPRALFLLVWICIVRIDVRPLICMIPYEYCIVMIPYLSYGLIRPPYLRAPTPCVMQPSHHDPSYCCLVYTYCCCVSHAPSFQHDADPRRTHQQVVTV